MELQDFEKKFIKIIKQKYNIPDDVLDKKILEMTNGTYLQARIKLGLAWDDFKNSIKSLLSNVTGVNY